MKLIWLTVGQYAIVDDGDYSWLSQWQWQAQWNPKTRSYYATRHRALPNGKREKVWMHRQILGLKIKDGKQGDHVVSGETLDNRRSNLRVASRFQNGCNRRPNIKGSGFKGATFNLRSQKWVSQIQVNGNKLHLGRFESAIEAHAAYCEAAKKYHGEFARTA